MPEEHWKETWNSIGIEMEGLWKGELTSMTDLLCKEICVISKTVKREPEMFG
jgi:hypothetical protein